MTTVPESIEPPLALIEWVREISQDSRAIRAAGRNGSAAGSNWPSALHRRSAEGSQRSVAGTVRVLRL
jgi:hypothetical protein